MTSAVHAERVLEDREVHMPFMNNKAIFVYSACATWCTGLHHSAHAVCAGGAGPQADVWALLDSWSGGKGAEGLLLAVFERYTVPLWGLSKSQAPGLDQARLLTHELYLEAETKLIFMFAFMAHCESTVSC